MTICIVIVAYLFGSISSAVLICRLRGLPDPRTQGSNNPGATNVLRMSNKATAAAVLLFDVLKGMVPVWGAYKLGVEPLHLGFIAIAACLGHMYPIFFNFKGGKAVATAFGALAPISWIMAFALIITWGLIVKFSRYSSLAAIVTVSLAPLYTFIIKPLYTNSVTMLSVLIIFRHRDNIMRLIKGKEDKV
ncbi:glycerol-3-phosphate 1-O-acyltransferase PlsY [Thalassotalea sp. HSM 43]|uniref:glycerol-3-phosphate 1-O-acyltransferase PlsY n=1 Tax=Thalassotalea sp. HSM 43 TaxID=2552945 RepID=UPI00108212E3|nr:glycerol-3-phosphate 1-O-acyltransferase PlsY [Thalassotalea sp. HSM 43]QBY03720.1 glycerol-3-phosphate 1-O-acyltransferase PlsY [Thalassotalea sp. HSM 43]